MSKLWPSLLAAIVTGALLVSAGRALTGYVSPPDEVGLQRPRALPSHAIEGLSIPRYASDGQVNSLLQVGTCRLRTKPGGLFGWSEITVAEMSDVQIDVQQTPAPTDSPTTPGRTVSGQAVAFLKDVPRYLRWPTAKDVEVREITIRMHNGGDTASTIQAARLSPLPRGQCLLQHRVVLTANHGNRRLTADEVVWWPDLAIYAIKGGYILTEAGSIQRGKHALFHTNLETITNNEEIAHYEQRATFTASFATTH
ncbi:MAG TPA: hypothetical protein VMV72_13035 [Verrucomicrobiae bacterium]|nr:hypothetical protein [Verrucomicrobiae bacterium]